MLRSIAAAALALAAGQAFACYTVYDRSNAVVYHAQTPPVDMSLPLHQTIPVLWPGGHMVFDNSLDCPVQHAVPRPRPGTPPGTSPLLTDRQTAAAMGLPHQTVAGNIVVVPGQALAKVDLPTFSVIPTDVAAVPDTRVLGGPGSAPRAR